MFYVTLNMKMASTYSKNTEEKISLKQRKNEES